MIGKRCVSGKIVKKALAAILYSLGKASFGMLAHIFWVARSLTYQ